MGSRFRSGSASLAKTGRKHQRQYIGWDSRDKKYSGFRILTFGRRNSGLLAVIGICRSGMGNSSEESGRAMGSMCNLVLKYLHCSLYLYIFYNSVSPQPFRITPSDALQDPQLLSNTAVDVSKIREIFQKLPLDVVREQPMSPLPKYMNLAQEQTVIFV